MGATFLAFVGMVASVVGNEDTFSLYRTSVADPNLIVHVATFDTANGRDYNLENCQLAARLFQAQPNVKTRFWCERGRLG